MEEEKVVLVLPNPELEREQCVKECIGCNKIYSDHDIGDVCIAYFSPKAKQKLGCPLQSNKEIEKVDKKWVNPIKHSKRKKKGR